MHESDNKRDISALLADAPDYGADAGPSIDDLCNEIKSLRAQLNDRDRGFAKRQMQCGHPVACIQSNDPRDDSTHYCGWCASLDKARDEERARWQPMAKTAQDVIDRIGNLHHHHRTADELRHVLAYGPELANLRTALKEVTK